MEKINREAKFYIHDKFGEVPIGWEIKTLDECFNFFPNASYSRANLTEVGDCYYVHYGDIHTKFNIFLDFEKHELPFVTLEMAKRFKKLKDGDLIMADASEDYDGVGKAVEVVNIKDKEAIAGLHTLHLRCKNDCFVKGFAGYVLNNEKVRHSILSSATGIKVYSVSKTGLKKIFIPRPSKPEQTAIASILSKVDEVIAATEKSIHSAERLKKVMMQNLLTGRLRPDGTWRTEEEFYVDEKFGKVPIDWKVKKIIDCFKYYPTASYSRSKLLESGECMYVHYGDIHTKFERFLDLDTDALPFITSEMAYRFTKMKEGDLILSDTSEDYAGVGKCVEIKNLKEKDIISGLHTFHLRDKSGLFINGYKGYLFDNPMVRLAILRLTTGIKVYSVSKTTLGKVLLPIPPIEDQKIILRQLDSISQIIDDKRKKVTTLQRLKKSLMQNLLTGKVRLKTELINEHKVSLTEIPNLQPA